MLDQRWTTRLEPNGLSSPLQSKQAPPAALPTPRYKHILVPVTGAVDDRETMILAAELANLHRASLTLLAIEPAAPNAPSVHWLGAIDSLHAALDGNGRRAPNGAPDLESSRSKLREVFQREVPHVIRDGLAVSTEVQTGEFAETIARYAEETAADLVVMSGGQPRWWRPLLPAPVRRTMQLTRQPVILVRPDVNARKRSTLQVPR